MPLCGKFGPQRYYNVLKFQLPPTSRLGDMAQKAMHQNAFFTLFFFPSVSGSARTPPRVFEKSISSVVIMNPMGPESDMTGLFF